MEGKTLHTLKTWPEYFEKVLSGDKTFEVRKNDRDYKAGDYVQLLEFNPKTGEYSGMQCTKRISYILHGGAFGIKAGYCVMQLQTP